MMINRKFMISISIMLITVCKLSAATFTDAGLTYHYHPDDHYYETDNDQTWFDTNPYPPPYGSVKIIYRVEDLGGGSYKYWVISSDGTTCNSSIHDALTGTKHNYVLIKGEMLYSAYNTTYFQHTQNPFTDTGKTLNWQIISINKSSTFYFYLKIYSGGVLKFTSSVMTSSNEYDVFNGSTSSTDIQTGDLLIGLYKQDGTLIPNSSITLKAGWISGFTLHFMFAIIEGIPESPQPPQGEVPETPDVPDILPDGPPDITPGDEPENDIPNPNPLSPGTGDQEMIDSMIQALTAAGRAYGVGDYGGIDSVSYDTTAIESSVTGMQDDIESVVSDVSGKIDSGISFFQNVNPWSQNSVIGTSHVLTIPNLIYYITGEGESTTTFDVEENMGLHFTYIRAALLFFLTGYWGFLMFKIIAWGLANMPPNLQLTLDV